MTASGLQEEIDTQTCPLHLIMESPWRNIWFTASFVVLLDPGSLVAFRQLTLRGIVGIDVMGQLSDIIKGLTGAMSGEEPQALEAPVMNTHNTEHT